MVTKLSGITEKLKTKQTELSLNDTDFAKKIGISRSLWSLMKAGKREPGPKFIKAVLKAFPEFTVDMMNFLADTEAN